MIWGAIYKGVLLLTVKRMYSFLGGQSNTQYHIHIKGDVGGYDFDSDCVDYILAEDLGFVEAITSFG